VLHVRDLSQLRRQLLRHTAAAVQQERRQVGGKRPPYQAFLQIVVAELEADIQPWQST
jgi:hypothetical protein